MYYSSEKAIYPQSNTQTTSNSVSMVQSEELVTEIRFDFTDLNPFLEKNNVKQTPVINNTPSSQLNYPNLTKNTLPKPKDVLTVTLNGLKGQYTWIGTTSSTGLASLVIFAKTKNDIHISFSETPSNKSYMYEIVIGGSNNTVSEIRRYSQGTVLDKKKTSGLCDDKHGGFYWALCENGVVTVGRGKIIGQDVVLSCTDPYPLNVKYIGLSSWDTRVEYQYKETFDAF